MSPRLMIVLSAMLLAGCDRPAPAANSAPTPPPAAAPVAASSPDNKLPPAFPPDSCTLDGYKSFFEAFVRTPTAREALTAIEAKNAAFDVDLRDYSWVQASQPDISLDIDETRSGSTFIVTARPVERDENDEVTRVLGPARTYRFVFSGSCWRFAGGN